MHRNELPTALYFERIYVVLTAALLLSTVVGDTWVAFNSICTILLTLTWLVEGGFRQKWQRLKSVHIVYFVAFFFLLYLTSFLTSANKREAFSMLQREFILAFIFFSKKPFSPVQVAGLLKGFVYAALVYMGAALLLATVQYFRLHDTGVFIYHALAGQVGSTAIFSSMLCVVAVAVLLFLPMSPGRKLLLYICFSIFILLLASRMFLFIHLVISGVHAFTLLKLRWKLVAVGALVALLLPVALVPNPVRARFQDMTRFQAGYLTQKDFNQGMYFDGLSLRVLYIRYSFEIMQEHHRYLVGVGSGDAAQLLRDKIRAYHMYDGDGSDGSGGGYLQYSFHDAYLESFVAFGIIGVVALVLLYGYIGYYGITRKVSLLRDLCIIIVCASFTDVIVINNQCDLALVLTICYLGFIYKQDATAV
ncbi:hypothetical protein DCC81_21415 [Chitinophaga parva]|uniref:O-antigen ligase-related domain-containing protein n=1 Tax=Chitinophaga parva TaxID=2169414 RepID=A0A2T7BD05_9BACT|nr:O-antigen ligase family protein [Chitinophaga parva]PUZ22974.1 hypothetical protein DCC81_21415 [Chitinophaga parva]